MLPRVAIVDAYSTANELGPLFADAGYGCVHVRSAPGIPAVYAGSFRPGDFAADIVHRGDLEATLKAVAEHRPVALVAGIESGVALADALGEALGLPSNGVAGAARRRDKFQMLDAVAAAGLRAPRQLRTADLYAALRWSADLGGRVVLKPVASAGNDRVAFCAGPDEVARAFRRIIGSESALAERNEVVLIQEYQYGAEYIVNTVSRDGRHHVCEIWQTTHLSANDVLDLIDSVVLLPRSGRVQDRLVPYVFRVLDALGIAHGAAHTEVKLTPDGPCLIETAARTCGGGLPVLARAAMPEGQLEWIVTAHVDPDRFHRRLDEEYAIERHVAAVGLISPCDGVLAGYPRLAEIRSLESFHGLTVTVNPGDRISRTVDDFTYPMRVSLRHEVEEVVLHDSRTVRQLDGPGFYDVAPG